MTTAQPSSDGLLRRAITDAGVLATAYAFSIKPTARGTYTDRVVWLADADHQGTQTASKVLTVS